MDYCGHSISLRTFPFDRQNERPSLRGLKTNDRSIRIESIAITFLRFDIRDRSRWKEGPNKRDQSRHLVSSFEGSSRLVEIVAFDRLERNPPSVHHISPTRLPTAQQRGYYACTSIVARHVFFQKRGKIDTRDTGIQPQDTPPIRDPTNRNRTRQP